MLLAWYALGEADTVNRPYKLRLASKYNKYTLERARIRRYADENGLLSTTRLGLHCTGGSWGPELPNFKTRQIEKYGVLAVITKFNACQFFLLYGMLIVMVASRKHWLCSCTHRSPTSFLGRTLTPPLFLHTSLLWPTRSTRTCSQRDGRSAASSLGSQVLERLRAASSLSSTSFMSQNQWRTS